MTGPVLTAVDAEVAAAVADQLEVGLGDLFAQGWQRYRRLRDAATATLSGGKQVVPLDSTKITSTQHPFVELSLDGAPVGRVDLDLTAEYDLHGVVAVVESGALTALRFGECDVTVHVLGEAGGHCAAAPPDLFRGRAGADARTGAAHRFRAHPTRLIRPRALGWYA